MKRDALKPQNLSQVWLLPLWAALAFPIACKDEAPCDDNQDSIGTGCFVKKEMPPDEGDGGSDSAPPDAGGGGAGGAPDLAPPGNPDAMFGSDCTKEDNSECGGPAPVCATDPLYYCTQLNCQAGEENEGACPEDWTCFKVPDKPSACVNLNAM